MIIARPDMWERSLEVMIADFLADLAHSNRSPHTRRAYATDLTRFVAFYVGPASGITADVLRAFFATQAHLSPASRARTQFPTVTRTHVLGALRSAREHVSQPIFPSRESAPRGE